MKRDLDTFQLNRSVQDQRTDQDSNIRAYSDSKNRASQEHWYRLKTAQTYTQYDERPSSVNYLRIQEGNTKLNQDHQTKRTQFLRLNKLLSTKKREGLSMRNKIQSTQYIDENSWIIQTEAVRQSDINFNCRRKAESVDKQLKFEVNKETLLRQEYETLKTSVQVEANKADKLQNDNQDMYRRVLDKQKIKKEMEDTLKRQEIQMRNLESTIDHLMLTEKGCLKIIIQYVQDTNLPVKSDPNLSLSSKPRSTTGLKLVSPPKEVQVSIIENF